MPGAVHVVAHHLRDLGDAERELRSGASRTDGCGWPSAAPIDGLADRQNASNSAKGAPQAAGASRYCLSYFTSDMGSP